MFRIEADEEVYQFVPPENGAGPTWCNGSTCIVRVGDRVFASGIETLRGYKPINNCRWNLYQRTESGWRLVRTDEDHRTREPSPMAAFDDGRFFLSTNPTLVEDPDVPAGPALPEILEFQAGNPDAPPELFRPVWDGDPEFNEHSYRSFAADAASHELILFQNIGYDYAEYAFRDADGTWPKQGRIVWPWEDNYDTPQHVRVCYPTVQLKDRALHFCGVSDVTEPYESWRRFKFELTGKKWDYDFRRLFYTWSNDITTGEFEEWVEIASRDETCGWIMPGDLWVAPDGRVHIVWSERAIDERLRDEFFPDALQRHSVEYAVVQDGQVIERRTVTEAVEGKSAEIPTGPRFQITPDRRIFVVYYVSGMDRDGAPVSENRISEVRTDGSVSEPVRLALSKPLTKFFTATVRGGSPESWTLEMFGTPPDENAMRYVRCWIEP